MGHTKTVVYRCGHSPGVVADSTLGAAKGRGLAPTTLH
jgi:hypothetical protein